MSHSWRMHELTYNAMSKYMCGDQVAKVFMQWLYDQGCRPNVFPPTRLMSRKHSWENNVFYWPPRCTKFAKITILNKVFYGISQQPPYMNYYQYGAWFIREFISQTPVRAKVKFPRFY